MEVILDYVSSIERLSSGASTLDELVGRACWTSYLWNELLPAALKLIEAEVEKRYLKYGGVPRYVLTLEQELVDAGSNRSIRSFISCTSEGYSARNTYWALAMEPSRYFTTWHLFQNTSPKESLKSPPQTLQALVKFALGNEKNGDFGELVSHRWFAKHVNDRNSEDSTK
ncbi:unnamed protein product [Phytophthora lilii]|uniref:Unnamed protein product n=1 Tax=Phytophthora lilii TaxID=2077276 RepID=A0A9W6WZN8_9STRA|nr:unnamed protein product [Phytophthora lilii]